MTHRTHGPQADEIRKAEKMSDTDTTPEAVERFEPYTDEGNRYNYGEMEPFDKGDWVRYEDYTALSARIAELEAECWRMQEERDRAIGWRDSDKARAEAAEQRAATLEAKLAKSRRSLIDGSELAHGVSFSKSETIASWGHRVEADINATLAEIQDG